MTPSRRNKARSATSLLIAALAVVLALALTGGASADPVGVDGYIVTSTVTQDQNAGTTTVTYSVEAPGDPGVKDISHVNVVVCAPDLVFDEITNGGALVDSDPSTGQSGPLVKWDNPQSAGTTEEYSYTVEGLYDSSPTILRIKAGLGVFDHDVDGLGGQCAQHGTLVIDKVTDPSGDPQSFDFSAPSTSDPVFSLADASTPESIDVAPGTYDVTEAETAGWDLTGVTCDDGSTTSLADRKASAEVAAGETVTCTFTNTKQAPPQENPGTPQQPGAPQVAGIQTPPPAGQQQVLGDRVVPGTAHIAGASGCQRKAFKVSVKGKSISKVAFYIDGKRVNKVRSSASGKVFSITVNPNRFKPGSHVVTAKVKFTKASNTRSKTLRARFARCVRATQPAFTG